MKALPPIFALVATALLLAQPILAGSPCAMDADYDSCGPECTMGMAPMAMDCPMAGATSDLSSGEACCLHASPLNVVRLNAPAAPKSARVVQVMAASLMPADARACGELFDSARASSSPPRYLLYEVFRI